MLPVSFSLLVQINVCWSFTSSVYGFPSKSKYCTQLFRTASRAGNPGHFLIYRLAKSKKHIHEIGVENEKNCKQTDSICTAAGVARQIINFKYLLEYARHISRKCEYIFFQLSRKNFHKMFLRWVRQKSSFGVVAVIDKWNHDTFIQMRLNTLLCTKEMLFCQENTMFRSLVDRWI